MKQGICSFALAALSLASAESTPVARATDAKPLCTEAKRACYETAAKAYFAGLLQANGTAVPFADAVRVTEQGKIVASSRAEMVAAFKLSGAAKAYRNVRMLVDEAAHSIVIFSISDVRPGKNEKPFSVRRAQRMKIERGLITEVELVFFLDANPMALWPDQP